VDNPPEWTQVSKPAVRLRNPRESLAVLLLSEGISLADFAEQPKRSSNPGAGLQSGVIPAWKNFSFKSRSHFIIKADKL
jgi:hypothetical protein